MDKRKQESPEHTYEQGRLYGLYQAEKIIEKQERNLMIKGSICPQCIRGNFGAMRCIERYSISKCFKKIKSQLTKEVKKCQ